MNARQFVETFLSLEDRVNVDGPLTTELQNEILALILQFYKMPFWEKLSVKQMFGQQHEMLKASQIQHIERQCEANDNNDSLQMQVVARKLRLINTFYVETNR